MYAQLVDDSTCPVLGNVATPVPLTLDGGTHTASVPLEQIAHTLKPGQSVTLQIVPSSFTYVTFHLRPPRTPHRGQCRPGVTP